MKKLLSLLVVIALNMPLAAMEPEIEVSPTVTVKPQKILFSFDGGGTRAIGAVKIMMDIFEALEKKLDRKIAPEDVIDLMGGTSAGGFIAIMLASGRALQDCFDLFMKHTEAIFSAGWWQWITSGNGYISAKYDPGPLEAVLKEVLGESQLEDVKIPAFVTTYVREKDEFVLLDSTAPDEFPNLQNVEACLATSAAPTYFPRPTLQSKDGPVSCEDGGVGANDPAFLVFAKAQHPHHHCLKKAKELHPDHNYVLVSIGTGQSLLPPLSEDPGAIEFVKEGISEVMSAARAATELMLETELGDDHYYRLQFESSEYLDTTDPKVLQRIIDKAHSVSRSERFGSLIDKLAEIIQSREKPKE